MSSKLLWGIIFILFLSCMVTESRRIEMSEEIKRVERRVREKVAQEIAINKSSIKDVKDYSENHIHYYNSKPKQLGTDSYENN